MTDARTLANALVKQRPGDPSLITAHPRQLMALIADRDALFYITPPTNGAAPYRFMGIPLQEDRNRPETGFAILRRCRCNSLRYSSDLAFDNRTGKCVECQGSGHILLTEVEV